MLNSISWQQYIVTLLIATILYYLFVWIVFFKAKFSLLPGIANFRQVSLQTGDEPDEVMTTAQHIMDEIRPLFDGRNNKNELILALQLKLKRYNEWTELGFRETINEFISSQSEAKCSILLSEEDQRVLWQ